MAMKKSDDRMLTLHSDPAKQVARILKTRYEAVRSAILKAVPRQAPGLAFSELAVAVCENLAPADLENLGSVGWHRTVVKLDLEARGKLRRLPHVSPQRLIRT